MRVLGVIVLAITSLAARSEASCVAVPIEECFCAPSGRVGVVVTESVDGGAATFRVESSQRDLVTDAGLTLTTELAETPGDRWLLLGDQRRPIDAQEKVTCRSLSVSLETIKSAALSPTCGEELDIAGVRQPRCDDTPGCSSAPLALLPVIAGLWLLRRRMR